MASPSDSIPAPAPAPTAEETTVRADLGHRHLAFLDPLRGFLTVLVVAHHAAQAYGPTGGQWPVSETPGSRGLALLLWLNPMFLMGLFFFLSGYLTPHSLARKGVRRFLYDRALRLGLPSLLVLTLTFLIRGRPEFLHLWFAVDLLALNLLYTLVAPRPSPAPRARRESMPSTPALLGYVFVLGTATALVRVVYPVDTWILVAGLLPCEPAHWVQYGTLYALGIQAARADWLRHLPRRLGASALGIAGLLILGMAFYSGWPGRTGLWFASGGWRWENLANSMLEAGVCVSLGTGLVWLFRQYAGTPHRWTAALAADAYGIYCVHLPIVVALHWGLSHLPPSPLNKFLLVTSFAVALSWGITRFVLRATSLGRRVF